jgi:hypothetical protein
VLAYSAVGRLGRRILAVGSTVGAVVPDAVASSNSAAFDGDRLGKFELG